MTVELQDILKANLVLVGLRVLETEEEVQTFHLGAGTEVATRPVLAPDSTLVLALERERITVETSNQRTVIQQDYPDVADLGRLAQIATLAFGSKTETPQNPPVVHGYNMDAVFRQGSGLESFTYIGQQLFDPTLPTRMGWELGGGIGNLTFMESAGRKWSFRVEPRAFDMQAGVFLSVNLEAKAQSLPNQEDIERAFRDCWEQTDRFATVLDEER